MYATHPSLYATPSHEVHVLQGGACVRIAAVSGGAGGGGLDTLPLEGDLPTGLTGLTARPSVCAVDHLGFSVP
jgi:hypothetical protein